MRWAKYLLMAAIIAIDQLSKLAVRGNLAIGESIPVIGDFFAITHISNYGGALSMFEHNMTLLIGIPLIAIVAAIWYMENHREAHGTLAYAIVLIASGGIGNLIDRLTQGFVTDFLDFTSIPGWNWIFNIADIAVCIGCFLMILYIFKFDKTSANADSAKLEETEETNGANGAHGAK